MPAKSAVDLDAWATTKTVLVTNGILCANAEIENRAINLVGGDWDAVIRELPNRHRVPVVPLAARAAK